VQVAQVGFGFAQVEQWNAQVGYAMTLEKAGKMRLEVVGRLACWLLKGMASRKEQPDP